MENKNNNSFIGSGKVGELAVNNRNSTMQVSTSTLQQILEKENVAQTKPEGFVSTASG